jgi:hypothetical protein
MEVPERGRPETIMIGCLPGLLWFDRENSFIYR